MALTGAGHLGCPGEEDEMVESRKHFYESAWKFFARPEEISSHDFRRKTLLSPRLHLRANWLLENLTSRTKLQCKKIRVLFWWLLEFSSAIWNKNSPKSVTTLPSGGSDQKSSRETQLKGLIIQEMHAVFLPFINRYLTTTSGMTPSNPQLEPPIS